jgi:hypothetical protein
MLDGHVNLLFGGAGDVLKIDQDGGDGILAVGRARDIEEALCDGVEAGEGAVLFASVSEEEKDDLNEGCDAACEEVVVVEETDVIEEDAEAGHQLCQRAQAMVEIDQLVERAWCAPPAGAVVQDHGDHGRKPPCSGVITKVSAPDPGHVLEEAQEQEAIAGALVLEEEVQERILPLHLYGEEEIGAPSVELGVDEGAWLENEGGEVDRFGERRREDVAERGGGVLCAGEGELEEGIVRCSRHARATWCSAGGSECVRVW